MPPALIENERVVETRFGPAASVGHEAGEMFDDAAARILSMVREGKVRAFGCRNSSSQREVIPAAQVSFSRLIDQDGLCIVPNSFPNKSSTVWREVTLEIDSAPQDVASTRPNRKPPGPKPVEKTRVLEFLRKHPDAASMKIEEVVAETKCGRTTASEALAMVKGELRTTPNRGQ